MQLQATKVLALWERHKQFICLMLNKTSFTVNTISGGVFQSNLIQSLLILMVYLTNCSGNSQGTINPPAVHVGYTATQSLNPCSLILKNSRIHFVCCSSFCISTMNTANPHVRIQHRNSHIGLLETSHYFPSLLWLVHKRAEFSSFCIIICFLIWISKFSWHFFPFHTAVG